MGKRFRNFPGGNSRGIFSRKCKGMSENLWRDFLAKTVKIDQRKNVLWTVLGIIRKIFAEVLGKMYGGEFSGGICPWKIVRECGGIFLGKFPRRMYGDCLRRPCLGAMLLSW